MEVRAAARYLRASPRKLRMVVDLIRGKKVEEALNILAFTPKVSAKMVIKLLKSAVANAGKNKSIDVDTLFIKTIFVDEGPTLKRFRPRAMGRASRIRKKMSHVAIILAEE